MSSPIYNAPAAPSAASAPEAAAPEAVEQESNESNVAVSSEPAAQEEAAPSADEDSVLAAANAAKEKRQEEQPKQVEKKPEQPKPQPPKKFKIKVDGSEEELDEDTIVKLAQLGRASNKRFQEAAQVRKQAEEFINLLKQDPRKVLTNPAIGVDPYKLAEDWLIEKLEQEKLSPEQQKIREYEQKLRSYEEEKRQQEEQRKAQEQEKLLAHYSQEYEKNIQDALASSGLPRTAKTVSRMAEYMSLALKNGIDLEPKNVVELVRQDYMKEIADLIGQTDGDALLQILGDNVANKIRKTDLARLKSPQQQPKPQPKMDGQEQPRDPQTKRFMSTHEWREWQEKNRQK